MLGRYLQARACVARVFDRFPRVLQKQTLLWVQKLCLNRRYIEKQRVEFIDRNEASPFCVMVSGLAAVLTKVIAPVPTLLGNFNNAILSVAKIAPVGIDIGRLRVATAQSDDGDGIRPRRRAG